MIELTEDAFLAKSQFQLQVLPMLREIGVRVSIDDFGTGYSSLSALADITADEIKVDRSFITAIHQRPRSQSVLQGDRVAGHALGMTVVAEGVETFEELAYLQAATRIRYAQGYYFAKPFFLDDFSRTQARSTRGARPSSRASAPSAPRTRGAVALRALRSRAKRSLPRALRMALRAVARSAGLHRLRVSARAVSDFASRELEPQCLTLQPEPVDFVHRFGERLTGRRGRRRSRCRHRSGARLQQAEAIGIGSRRRLRRRCGRGDRSRRRGALPRASAGCWPWPFVRRAAPALDHRGDEVLSRSPATKSAGGGAKRLALRQQVRRQLR